MDGSVKFNDEPVTKTEYANDPFGAKSVWQSHYDLAIETMHPISAVKAANAAALAYAEGNHYISMGGKGDAAEYRMVRSKEVGR